MSYNSEQIGQILVKIQWLKARNYYENGQHARKISVYQSSNGICMYKYEELWYKNDIKKTSKKYNKSATKNLKQRKPLSRSSFIQNSFLIWLMYQIFSLSILPNGQSLPYHASVTVDVSLYFVLWYLQKINHRLFT